MNQLRDKMSQCAKQKEGADPASKKFAKLAEAEVKFKEQLDKVLLLPCDCLQASPDDGKASSERHVLHGPLHVVQFMHTHARIQARSRRPFCGIRIQ